MYLDVCTSRQLRSEHFGCKKNENSTTRQETTRARPRPPPAESGEASKGRHATDRWASSRASSSMAQNLVTKRTSRGLTGHVDHPCIHCI